MSTLRTASKGMKIAIGVLFGLVAAVVVLIVVTTLVENGGSPKAEVVYQGGRVDRTIVELDEAADEQAYRQIVADQLAEQSNGKEGEYVTLIQCKGSHGLLAESSSGVGDLGEINTGLRDDTEIHVAAESCDDAPAGLDRSKSMYEPELLAQYDEGLMNIDPRLVRRDSVDNARMVCSSSGEPSIKATITRFDNGEYTPTEDDAEKIHALLDDIGFCDR